MYLTNQVLNILKDLNLLKLNNILKFEDLLISYLKTIEKSFNYNIKNDYNKKIINDFLILMMYVWLF